jgi:hypothetical protein
MMSHAIGNPVSCEILSVIHFLHITDMLAAEIRLELCTVYCQIE